MPFDRANRTYSVSDERLRAFRALTTEEKLRWVEGLGEFSTNGAACHSPFSPVKMALDTTNAQR